MSAPMEPADGGSQDFELNLAPVIDCLTVLITFILASAAYLSIGILDAGVSASGARAASPAPPPPVSITVELGPGHGLTLKVTGKESLTSGIHALGGDWNYAELGKRLGALHARWPQVSVVTLTAADKIPYEDVVRTLESIRKSLPLVLLGGF